MEPFTIRVSDDDLADLQYRLEHARYPDEIANDDWNYGANLAYIKELCRYWKDDYDWRKQEALLNSFDHYTTDNHGLRHHFIHQRSKHENAFPLIIQHGWPGSVFEFHKIIGPLTDPESHGGNAEDAFHVVCPSMPGYGWSEAPKKPGVGTRQIAEMNIELMRQLGYERYGAQGGDWGASVITWMGAIAPESLTAIHMNMIFVFPPRGDERMKGVTPEEANRLAEFEKTRDPVLAYQATHRNKPQSLGMGLNDSPLGLAAWIVEKFHGWSDCNGDLDTRFTKDELLTNLMIYWTTGTITSSLRLYFENHHSKDGVHGINIDRVDVPAGFAVFPIELFCPAKAWVERVYNVARWTVMPKGGHFAAMEEPDLLVEDIRTFFRAYR
jgi:pimeloyl-ACP methyl ester carboxylesterase